MKSAPLKAEPSPFKPTSPEARAALQPVVNDTYDWFKTLVRERRGLNDQRTRDRLRPARSSAAVRAWPEARRRGRQRARRGRLARAEKGVRKESAGARLEAARRRQLFAVQLGRVRGRSFVGIRISRGDVAPGLRLGAYRSA